ncbi:MAG: PAS domain S-box protein [Candidatus Aminicenantes bacterium]|nr:MAG: PAS domain S-box protein [Candidatus Aminicenantes bacterium]
MLGLYLTHLSIIPLTQLILSLIILSYLWRLKDKSKPTRFFTYFFVGNTLYLISFFIYNSALPAGQYWIAPLQYITFLIGLAILLQFVYSFPQTLPFQKLEAAVVLVLSVTAILIGAVLHGHFIYVINSGTPHPTPLFLVTSFLIAIEFFWCLVVLIRRIIYFSRQQGYSNWWQNFFRPREKPAKAARDLALILSVPLCTVICAFLRDLGILPEIFIHYLIMVVTILFYFALMVFYLNYAQESSTFMAKLVGASLVIVLTILATVGHLVNPLVRKTYPHKNLVSQDQSIYFQPTLNHIGFDITAKPSQFESQLGQKLTLGNHGNTILDLEFAFPFAGKKWEKIYIDKSCVVTFDSPLFDFAFWANRQIGITPLWLRTTFTNDSGVFQKKEPGKLTITWHNMIDAFNQMKRSVQLVLDENGSIQFNYQNIQGSHAFLVGLFSGNGYGSSAKTEVRFSKDLPISTSTPSVFENYYKDYRLYEHQKILPLAVMVILTSLLILLGFPLFFKTSLVKPLQTLLEGVKMVNWGRLYASVPVRYNDEIGFLTDSFNRMVQSLKQANERRREADHAKDKLLALNESILETAAEGIITLDQQGKILSFNKAAEEMFKYSRDEIIGKPDHILIKEQNGEQLGFLGHFMASGQKKKLGIEREFHGRQKNGQLFPLEFAVSASGSGKDRIFTVILHDLTEHKRLEIEKMKLETQLHQTQKLESIGTLAGGIAHGFNNLLTPIIGYTEMALESTSPRDSLHHDLKNILIASHRAKDIVKQLLVFSQADARKYEAIDIHAIVIEAIKLLRTTTPPAIELKLNLNPHCGAVFGDPLELKQVIINLYTNASYAMLPDGGILEVGLDCIEVDQTLAKMHPRLKPGTYAKIRVTDTGKGMDSQTMSHIFEPFFTTRDVGEGMGLGLSVAHGIVEKYGGVILVDSKVNKGTTFSVYLPSVPVKDAREKPDHEKIMTGEEDILLVGNEEIIVSIHKELLEREGYKVTAETSGLKALEIFRNQADNFDVVIIDQILPDMKGMQLTREILALRPTMPIILCARNIESAFIEKCREAGVGKIVMKPVTLQSLDTSIRELLTQQGVM